MMDDGFIHSFIHEKISVRDKEDLIRDTKRQQRQKKTKKKKKQKNTKKHKTLN